MRQSLPLSEVMSIGLPLISPERAWLLRLFDAQALGAANIFCRLHSSSPLRAMAEGSLVLELPKLIQEMTGHVSGEPFCV